MTRKYLQPRPAPAPLRYRRITVPVHVTPQNGFEELGRVLLVGAVVCFAAGAIARSL